KLRGIMRKDGPWFRAVLCYFKRGGAPGEVNCGDTAQRLGPLAQDGCIGAWAGYKGNREPHFRKRPLRAHCPESIRRGKDHLKLGAPRFKAAKELRRIGRDRIAGAFHHHSVGGPREAEIERIEEDVDNLTTTYRICGGK